MIGFFESLGAVEFEHFEPHTILADDRVGGFVNGFLDSWLNLRESTKNIYFLVIVLAGVLGFAALTRLRPDRQFWHDAIAGTRLVNSEPLNR